MPEATGRLEWSGVLATFSRIFYLVGRENPARWVALIAGAVVVSAFEMLGALMVFLLLALIADPTGQLSLPLIGDVRTYFDHVDDTTFLLAAATIMGIFFLATILVIAEFILVIGLASVLLMVSPAATGVAILVVGSAALLLLRFVQPRLQRLGTRAQEMRKRTLASLQQSLHGIRDIKVLRGEAHFGRIYRESRDSLSRSLYLRGTVLDLPRLVIETSLVGFILLLFTFSVVTGVAGEELLSTLGLFAYTGLRLQPSLQKLVGGLNNVRYSAPAVEEVYKDLRLVEQTALSSDDEAVEVLTFEEELRLDRVSFTYETGDRPAIQSIDLTIRPGEVLGICGPTGGGKSTLTDLIIGILEPTEGSVSVDGRDIAEHRPAWFENLGVVPQMIFLIDDSLRRNIALAQPDVEIDEEALDEAVRLAQLEEFIGSLPDGLDTVVGERGVRLSGGQRQRVAIARALYRRPTVLILDEGTSALDNTTETILMSSLERLRGSHTIILVAHRLSTVRNCDRIAYIDGGRLAGLGDYARLAAESPGFRALAQNS